MMPSSRMTRSLAPALAVAACLFAGTALAAAPVLAGGPLEVRLLYDNSGSMYPGYAPDGTGTAKSVSGAPYFHQDASFLAWLRDLLAQQTIVDGERVSLWAATSNGAFEPSDVALVDGPFPVRELGRRALLAGLPPPGRTTYLAESLRAVSRGFEGLIWLVTDNVVERRGEQVDAGIRDFFRLLQSEPRFRSVHLYKHPFEDRGRGLTATLAVYAILVADHKPADDSLADFDRKLAEALPAAVRSGGERLFPAGDGYLKLKDLNVNPIELVDIRVEQIADSREPQRGDEMVQLRIRGKVINRLTQHTITAGTLTLRLASDLEPVPGAGGEVSVEPIRASAFAPVPAVLPGEIKPGASRELELVLTSREPIGLRTVGFGAWWKSATSGLTVEFRGEVEAKPSEGLPLRFERAAMRGIFGIDLAGDVFQFPDSETLHDPLPTTGPVTLAFSSGTGRQLLLVVLALLLLGLLSLATWWFSRTSRYRIKAGDEPERIVALRRLARAEISYRRHALGALERDLLGESRFRPREGNAALSVKPMAEEGHYLVSVRDEGSFSLVIEPWTQGGLSRPSSGPRPPRVRRSSPGSSAPVSAPDAAAAAPRARPTIPRPR